MDFGTKYQTENLRIYDNGEILFVLNCDFPSDEKIKQKQKSCIQIPEQAFNLYRQIEKSWIKIWEKRKLLVGYGLGGNVAQMLTFGNLRFQQEVIMFGGLPPGNKFYLERCPPVKYLLLTGDIWAQSAIKFDIDICQSLDPEEIKPPFTLGCYLKAYEKNLH